MHDGHHHHHGHDHPHDHAHSHAAAYGEGGFTKEDEQRALLNYMYEHNQTHASEIDLMADQIEGAAGEKLKEATALYYQANEILHEVLHMLEHADE